MISKLINSLFIGILVADVLERRYPEELKNFLIKASFDLIYFYSKLEIFLSKSNNKINKFIENNPKLLMIKTELNKLSAKRNQPDENIVYKVVNGKICGIYPHELSDDFDFNLIKFYDEQYTTHVKMFYDKCIPKNFEQSNIKFILIEFKVGENNPYKIDLKTNNINYCIVDNKFNKKFFIFYINQHLANDNVQVNENEKCSIKIIDQDINTLELDFTDKDESIVLGKDSYQVLVTNHGDNLKL